MPSIVRAVLLDFGGVLGLPQDPVRAASMARLCRLPPDRFLAAYQRDRLELDRGSLENAEYWRRILEAGGVEPGLDLVERLVEEDTRGWTRVNRRVVDWSYELREAGYLTAILSNMPQDKLDFMRGNDEFSWISDFEAAVFSCDLGIVKPEPGIYRACLGKLGAAPGECVFLDDAAVNVEAAHSLGIQGILFRSAAEAAPELQQLWGLPVARLKEGGDA